MQAYARKLGKRIDELGIPIYLYENAALAEERKIWRTAVKASTRPGEKVSGPKLAAGSWKDRLGLAKRTGATAVGARDFLVAYNVNLNTTSTRRANAIAFDIRERGRVMREGIP